MNLPPDEDDYQDAASRIDLVPAVDVIFSILALTIVTSATLSRNVGLPVQLPTAQMGQPQTKIDVTVTIRADGRMDVDGQLVTIDTLAQRLQQLTNPAPPTNSRSLGQPLLGQPHSNAPTLQVILRADAAVPHGQVVAILDILQTIEGVQLAIGVIPSNRPSPTINP